jgi:hypothetical protein
MVCRYQFLIASHSFGFVKDTITGGVLDTPNTIEAVEDSAAGSPGSSASAQRRVCTISEIGKIRECI